VTGRFIAFEGGEGCGKSTQASLLGEDLDALVTFQPGGTDLGREIRGLLLDPSRSDISDRAEALLMAADRAQHVDQLVRPTLESGRHVISDRYLGSSLAYQGYARGMDIDQIRALSEFATAGLYPELVILLQVPLERAAERLLDAPDRFEGAGAHFHQRVADGFLTLAETDERWVVLDGTGTIDEVRALIRSVVADRLHL
jgi:dTMP kinase